MSNSKLVNYTKPPSAISLGRMISSAPDDGDGRRETNENTPGAERVGYIDVDRFVTACLTRNAALTFIARQSHRLREPFVYVESLHRNEEMIALRNHLMSDPCST